MATTKENITSIIKNRLDVLLTPWLTEDGTVWVDYTDEKGVMHSMRPSNRGNSDFVSWLLALCIEEYEYFPRQEFLTNMQNFVMHKAKKTGVTRKTAVRIGGDLKTIYVDMCDGLGRLVTIGPGAITVGGEAPSDFRFIRSKGMLPLPKPVTEDNKLLTTWLRKYIDTNESDICLMAAWLVGCMRPKGPYPVLILTGEQGSGKSTTARMLRRLVDPHSYDLREPFEERRDLVAATKNSFILGFDNVSFIRHWFSDALCRISTGTAALGGRALYTDDDEVATMACRPIILNGIPDFAERGDLIDRAIQIHLPTISPKKRMDDDEYWRNFEEDYPKIVGALYECASEALSKVATIKLEEKPRMSAFAVWVVAAEEKLGWKKGFFMKAYKTNRDIAEASLLEFNSMASAIMRMMDCKPAFYGTYSDLFGHLAQHLGPKEHLPPTSHSAAAELKRIKPLLERQGIDIRTNGRKTTGEDGKGRTMVEIRKYELAKEPVSKLIEGVLNG